MNNAKVGVDNTCFEMESRKGTEARACDEVAGKSKTPETSADTVASRPMLLIAAALVAVAFLTALATLVLALTMMLSQNSSTASKDSTDVYGEWNHKY